MGLTSIADASLARVDADCLLLRCCASQLVLLHFDVPELINEDLSLLLAEVSRHGPRHNLDPNSCLWPTPFLDCGLLWSGNPGKEGWVWRQAQSQIWPASCPDECVQP